MDEQERDKMKHILRRIRMTMPGETICLAYWETGLLLKHIDELKRRITELRCNHGADSEAVLRMGKRDGQDHSD